MNVYLQRISELFHYVPIDNWLLQISFVLLVTVVLFYLKTVIYRRLMPRFEASKNMWDDLILHAIHKPLGYCIWVQGLFMTAAIAGSHLSIEKSLLLYIIPGRKLIMLLLVIWFFLRLVHCVERYMLERSHKKTTDPTTVHAIGRIVKIIFTVTGGLVILQTFGVGISGILAFGGIGGAALAFASQDLLSNFFGGLILYLDRPFKVGDWIRSPDKVIEGTVEWIGWRVTRIRTFDLRPLYVPNATFTKVAIENASRMRHRRINTRVGVRYDDAKKIKTIVSDIQQMLETHPEIEPHQTIMVNFVAFNHSSLDLDIYAFTKTREWAKYRAVQQDVFLKTMEIIANHGAQCAFPTTTLHVVPPEKGGSTATMSFDENPA